LIHTGGLVFKKILIILIFFSQTLLSQIIHQLTVDRFTHYKITDWISYAPALIITSIDMDENYIYFGTRSGGILRYDKYTNHWEYPYTMSSGLRSNQIIRVVYNPDEGFLYAQTPVGIDVYKPAEKYWQPSSRYYLPSGKIPTQDDFKNYSRNEKNSFRYPPYYRPANSELPDFFTDVNLIYHPGGILYDQYNREFRFTDRIVDSWQRLWVGTNGFGPMMGELDNIRLKSMPQSIPDISPRDIYIDHNQIWIGGFRKGTAIGGITRWDLASSSSSRKSTLTM